MIDFLSKLFGIAPKPDYAKLMAANAVILDVRSAVEYAGGNIKGSLHIPVDQLAAQLFRLKDKDTPIITCCASGMRSAAARRILLSNGYAEVYNGGGWQRLQQQLKQ